MTCGKKGIFFYLLNKTERKIIKSQVTKLNNILTTRRKNKNTNENRQKIFDGKIKGRK